jgi:hypothetical protein
MHDFEKLGSFYLGKKYDLANKTTQEDLVLYDAKDLCTHAVCVGMTGSGKTGLCLSLLEEAAIDNIPAICIDPKGDLGNLLLTFPQLQPSDFQPWIEPAEATRKGTTVEELAAKTAQQWKEGLAAWGQDAARIQRFRDAVDISIYTPGSSAGLPLTVLKSFAAPPASTLENADAMRERLTAAASGLLTLLGVDDDPLRSREHILLQNILDNAWRAGQDVTLSDLIRSIQQPPFDKVGVIDLDSFFPEKERFELAMSLNNLMASPGFTSWMEGEPLDIQRLYYTPSGKPRLTIISIAHLSDPERMFFVTLLLNEIISWMRNQSGTTSLRALLYMDEVFGYFPPTANPPSKTPMLTLLKQARAYGLGVVLATQNPVDLDYKGLSNAGTWFLGRLQTERDKARVLEGLEGASAAAGAAFDRGKMEATLAGLGNRVFLMNNVHEDEPVVLQTRWALSYLRGPITRDQISLLMREKKTALPAALQTSAAATTTTLGDAEAGERPILPPTIPETFLPCRGGLPKGAQLVYRPGLLGEVKVHFTDTKTATDIWENCTARVCLADGLADSPWDEAALERECELEFDAEPADNAHFAPLPSELLKGRTFSALNTKLKEHVYREHRLSLFRAPDFKKASQADEIEGDFRARLGHELKEQRDEAVELLRKKYAPKIAMIEEQIRKAEQKIEKEKEQASSQTLQSMVSFGASILGAFMGRKLGSSANLGRAATSVRSATKIFKERQDVGHAEDTLEVLHEKLTALEAEFTAESNKIAEELSPDCLKIEPFDLQPKKSDISITRVVILWTPCYVHPDGRIEEAV